MKRIFLVGIIIGIVGLFWLGRLAWFGGNDVTTAQTSDIEYHKLLERDRNVPQAKVDKAYAEAKKIQENMLAIIASKKPEFKLYSRHSLHFNRSPGRHGTMLDSVRWRTSKTQLGIDVNLGLRKEEELILFRDGLKYISMGVFFEIANIGDEAVLVKNVDFNTRMTNVGLHFVKGRAQVDVYITNRKRKTEKNEKELMEIVRLIEPLIIARRNFDDP